MTSHHKSIRVRMHPIELNAYAPNNPGIQCTFGDFDYVNNEVTIHFACSDHPMLAPEERRTMADIENEIRALEPRIIKDNHVDLKLPFHHGIKFLLDHHALDGQYDHLRSKAIMTSKVKLPKVEIKEVNKYYEKQKVKPLDENQKEFTVGEIIDWQ